MNSKLKPPKAINMFADIAGRKDNIEILELNQKVRKILDYPINAYDNKKVDSKFRTGDMRFSKEIYKIKHIILNPNIPPLYMVNKKDNEENLDNTHREMVLIQKCPFLINYKLLDLIQKLMDTLNFC